jgi:hypothetical protein
MSCIEYELSTNLHSYPFFFFVDNSGGDTFIRMQPRVAEQDLPCDGSGIRDIHDAGCLGVQ